MHLIVDGYGSDPRLLQDEGFIYGLLDRFPAQIGMKKVTPPFVLIAESHITIHTFVERRLLNIDIFSCKEFDAVEVVRQLREEFKLTRVRSHLLRRGLEYPDFDLPLEMEPARPRGRSHGPPC